MPVVRRLNLTPEIKGVTIKVRNNLPLKGSYNVTCLIALVGVLALQSLAPAQEKAKPSSPDPLAISREDRLKVFEKLWEAINTKYFDPQFNGVNWMQMK